MRHEGKAESSWIAEGRGSEPRAPSRKSIYWILAGLVIAGILAGYNWLRSLPRD